MCNKYSLSCKTHARAERGEICLLCALCFSLTIYRRSELLWRGFDLSPRFNFEPRPAVAAAECGSRRVRSPRTTGDSEKATSSGEKINKRVPCYTSAARGSESIGHDAVSRGPGRGVRQSLLESNPHEKNRLFTQCNDICLARHSQHSSEIISNSFHLSLSLEYVLSSSVRILTCRGC